MATEQELQSLFNTLDGDKDGKVSINELFLSPGLSAIISSETGISSPRSYYHGMLPTKTVVLPLKN